jgi:flavin reductase (DIM6/NTAB) family NADH-FMN oxidoreductase RutF
VLVCLGHEVTVIDAFRGAQHFGINVLGEDQQELSERFARRGADRFDGLAWIAGQTGVPLIPGALAAMECRVHQRFVSGDHDIFVGEMLRSQVIEGEPLIYFASRYRGLNRV